MTSSLWNVTPRRSRGATVTRWQTTAAGSRYTILYKTLLHAGQYGKGMLENRPALNSADPGQIYGVNGWCLKQRKSCKTITGSGWYSSGLHLGNTRTQKTHKLAFTLKVKNLKIWLLWYWGWNVLGEICQYQDCWWRSKKQGADLNTKMSRLFAQPFVEAQIIETSKLRVTGLCKGNPPVTGGFPSQRASNTETCFHLMTSSLKMNTYFMFPKNIFNSTTRVICRRNFAFILPQLRPWHFHIRLLAFTNHLEANHIFGEVSRTLFVTYGLPSTRAQPTNYERPFVGYYLPVVATSYEQHAVIALLKRHQMPIWLLTSLTQPQVEFAPGTHFTSKDWLGFCGIWLPIRTLTSTVNKFIAVELREWMNDYTEQFPVCVITYPRPNPDAGLV